MHTILLITNDDGSLRNEIEAVVPEDFSLSSVPLQEAGDAEAACILFDIDTADVQDIKNFRHKTFVVALTNQEKTGLVMEAATWGAYEVLRRPVRKDQFSRILNEFLALRSEMERVLVITKDTIMPAATCVIAGRTSQAMSLCDRIARVAQVDVPVLITGETGTGKELVAEAFSQLSSRFGKPFVIINSAAMPDNLIESELFGYEAGAFTGAVAAKEGMLKAADGGIVFFDEIGELPLSLQGKLLRFLQTQAFYPVGSTKKVEVNVRVISATNRNLAIMVQEGKFREDLYHRLRVATVHVPPLRERKRDITPLVQCLFDRHVYTSRKPIKGVSRAFLEQLLTYDWPGNIRELENTIRSAIALCKTDYLTTLDIKDLGVDSAETPVESEDALAAAVIPYARQALKQQDKNIYDKVHAEVDRHLLEYVLAHTGGNQSETARLLGINRLTLRKKLGLTK